MLRKLYLAIKSFLDKRPFLKRLYFAFAKFCCNHGLTPPLSGRTERVEQTWREQSSKTPERSPDLYIEHDESIDLLFMDILPYLDKDARILEIGCNAGRNLNYLYHKGFTNLTGIEIGIKAEDAMQEHFPAAYQVTDYLCGNAYEMICKLPSDHFDLVFAHSVLVNIAPKWNGIFGEMARVSKSFILIMESEGSYSSYPRDFEKMFRRVGCKQILYKYYSLDGQKKRYLPKQFDEEQIFRNNTIRLFVHNA